MRKCKTSDTKDELVCWGFGKKGDRENEQTLTSQ
jgi:hypothetical protein